jgi:deoxycytidylate deaminase
VAQRSEIYEKEILRRDITNYQKAVIMAGRSSYSTRVGCVAAIGTRFLCGTFNTFRNDAKNVNHLEASRHAEHNCIGMIPTEAIPKVTLHIARINRQNAELPSRPCATCIVEIVALGIREIVYLGKNKRILKEYW